MTPYLLSRNLFSKWVHQNIEYFGGDKAKITIFGCSAGGRSVGAQLMTPYNDGLIFGAVGQETIFHICFGS